MNSIPDSHFGGCVTGSDSMVKGKKDSSPKENAEYDNKPRMLSMEELRIISDMVMNSLREDLNKIGLNTKEDSYDDEALYEDASDDDNMSFPAHKVQERFYAVNDPTECPICGSKILNFGHYHLEFGSNIRKKASFCGIDCLQQFITELSYSKGF